MTERTLVLIKPDGVQRALIGRVLARYEERGLQDRRPQAPASGPGAGRAPLRRASKASPSSAAWSSSSPSGPLVAVAVEGPGAIAMVRAMNGATNPAEAAPGTIRGDLAVDARKNLVHASDGTESAAAELALWFEPRELLVLRARRSTAGCSAARGRRR